MSTSQTLTPFANESEVLAIGEMTIENRLDRVSIYGSLDLTRDKAGLSMAKALKANLDLIVASLEAGPLPDQVAVAPPGVAPNPFSGSNG
ncbi:MAG: hypothetical protein INH12_00640 [Cupriavidus sp.]|jgi:hypothetical protein|uniref:hypothetical protein n=1 Tax=Cupriavidus sp. TaxID=1873897 RepID=UPI0025BA867D|nr:hypothetical protein [Cupriavidus sp.]MCA3182255.1 hypothetical protein [Cupriavidus sp.]MCA3188579.1 hypothetical protein [Cupriavidus sp.]MCA3231999.1 hypothetical protein [Cupriavidus sp.]MCA3775044.1 hypothetical protein [Cutibacterium sp.]